MQLLGYIMLGLLALVGVICLAKKAIARVKVRQEWNKEYANLKAYVKTLREGVGTDSSYGFFSYDRIWHHPTKKQKSLFNRVYDLEVEVKGLRKAKETKEEKAKKK